MLPVDFYFWSDQCPHNGLIKACLNAAAADGLCAVSHHDLAVEAEPAVRLGIFSPSFLLINRRIRWHGPISRAMLEAMSRGEEPVRAPYRVNMGSCEVRGELRAVTEETVNLARQACTPEAGEGCFTGKAAWIAATRRRYGLPHLGFLHLLDGVCVGGAEFVPSAAVPYPIPRRHDAAFLTCAYLSDEAADYKGHPLRRLEEELPRHGFRSLLAVASEDVVMPNGPLAWFLARGYTDLGEVCREVGDGARMHLLEKKLELA